MSATARHAVVASCRHGRCGRDANRGVSPWEDVVVDRLCEEPTAIEDHVESAHELDDEDDVGVHLEAEHEAIHTVNYTDVPVQHGREDEEEVQKHGEQLDADHLLCAPLALPLLLVLRLHRHMHVNPLMHA